MTTQRPKTSILDRSGAHTKPAAPRNALNKGKNGLATKFADNPSNCLLRLALAQTCLERILEIDQTSILEDVQMARQLILSTIRILRPHFDDSLLRDPILDELLPPSARD